MTEDILFNNIYIGHSVEDAQALAAETFDVKRPLEVAADKASHPIEEDDEEAEDLSLDAFKADPFAFLRGRVIAFVEAAKVDPVAAVKAQPQTAAGVSLAALTFFSMVLTLFGLIGGQQKPITKVCCFLITSLSFVAKYLYSRPRRPMLPPPMISRSPRRLLLHLQARSPVRRLTLQSRNASNWEKGRQKETVGSRWFAFSPYSTTILLSCSCMDPLVILIFNGALGMMPQPLFSCNHNERFWFYLCHFWLLLEI